MYANVFKDWNYRIFFGEWNIYNMKLIKRSPNEEKWRVQKKLSNQFIILTLNKRKIEKEKKMR